METKDIIKYAAIAVGAYYVYTMFIAPATATATPSPAPATGAGAGAGGAASQFPISPGKPPTSGTDTLPTHNPTPPPPPPPAGNATLSSGDVGSDAWKARVKALLVAAAGGGVTNSQGTWRKVDEWSYYYQLPSIGGAGSISPGLMQGIIDGTMAANDRNALIIDSDFVNALAASHAAGLGFIHLGGLGSLYWFN